MTKLLFKFASILCVAGLFSGETLLAQNLGSTVRVYAVPDGAQFSVDGQQYVHAMSAIWPKGSKHTLAVDNSVQFGFDKRYVFRGWTTPSGTLPPGAYQTITADPSISEYRADFGAQYMLTLSYFDCPDPKFCDSPGIIYVNNAAVKSDQQGYYEAGSIVTLVAVPNPGYIFAGWAPGAMQTIQGPTNKVEMIGPMVVYPQFTRARPIQMASVPDGLVLLADRTTVTTPTTLEWGWDTVHTVGVTTPQMDRFGKWWAFTGWSDGGASTHSYTVASSTQPATITANFAAAAVTAIQTVPSGLAVKVDGRDTWASYNFIWGVGEKHKLDAPLQLTSADGRAWKFSSWSIGGPAQQDYVVPASTVPLGTRVTANYTPLASVQVSSTLSGVTIQVDGGDCSMPCELMREPGTSIRVKAPVNVVLGDGVRADFNGWPGSGSTAGEASYTLGAEPLKLVLEYTLMNRLQASSNPSEGANWRMDPVSPDGFYDSLATVTVSVSARPGFRFKRWNGDLSGTLPYGAVPMNTPKAVEAMLERIPYVPPSGVANAASGLPGAGVAPGSIASIFGGSLANTVEIGPDNPLAQSVGGVSVRIGERYLPLFFVSPTQVNVQLPPDLGEGNQTLVLNSVGMPDVQATFPVVRNSPGLFQTMVGSDAYAVATHQDGSPVSADAPAQPGELITLFGTGFGPTDRGRPIGFAVPDSPRYNVIDPAEVRIGDLVVPAEAAYAVPGRVGVDAISFRMPAGLPSGPTKLRVAINSQESAPTFLQ